MLRVYCQFYYVLFYIKVYKFEKVNLEETTFRFFYADAASILDYKDATAS